MLEGLSKEYKRIFKDVPPKEGKKLKETTDNEKFYRVVDGVFYLPSISYLKNNLKELQVLNETFNTYYKAEDTTGEDWKWENLNCRHITGERETIAAIQYLKTQKEIAVDIETTGLSFYDDKLLLIVFAYSWNNVIIINTFTKPVIDELKDLFSRENIKFIWHNGKFDIARLKQFIDVDARVDEDTMLMHYIGFNENRGTHGLGYLAMLYLQAPNWEKTLDDIKRKICKEKKIRLEDFNYGMFPEEDLIRYAFFDGLATYRLYKVMSKEFPERSTLIYRKLIEASNCFAEIERCGVYVDQEMIEHLDKKLTEEHKILIKQINDIAKDYWEPNQYMIDTKAKTAPEEFNVNSPQQLKWILHRMGHKIDDTNEKTLKEINSEFTNLILKLRKNNKYHRTYVKGLSEAIEKDGRIHTTYNLHGTVTGRLSSSKPNLQNTPRDATIKNIFRATPGYVLVQADYSQAELRVLAVLSGDPWLQDVYKQGDDLHDKVAEQYWGKDFTSEDRVKAKAVNFGIAYGRTEHTLAPDLNISLAEARKLLDDWYKPMPYVKKFFNERIKMAFEEGISTTPFGRTRNFIITPYNKFNIRNEAMNTPIQSVASDLTLFSLIEIHKELKEKNLGRIVLTVHDSIIVETKPEYVEKVKEIMIKHMTEIPKKYLKTDVPFTADIDVGIQWGEMD